MTSEVEQPTLSPPPQLGRVHDRPELPYFGDEFWVRIVGGTGVHQCSKDRDSVTEYYCEDCLIRWPCVYARYAYMEPRLEALAEALRAKGYPLLYIADVVSWKSEAFPSPDLRPDSTDYAPWEFVRNHEYAPMPWTVPTQLGTVVDQ